MRNASGKVPQTFHLLRLPQPPFHLHFLGHIPLDGHIVDNLARGIAHRRDHHLFFIQGGVFLPVRNVSRPDFSAGDRFPHLFVKGVVVHAAPYQARILPQRLRAGVARDLLERRVHIDNGPIGLCDHD